MKVKITGKIMKYVKSGSTDYTAEIKNATVTVLESGGGDTPTGESLTCAQAAAAALALDDKASTTESYSVTGYITDVFATISSNQQSFWMADTKDGGKVFEAYWANLPAGTSAFTAGMKVRITGPLMRYGTTPEIKNATVEILEGGGGDTPATDCITMDFTSNNWGLPSSSNKGVAEATFTNGTYSITLTGTDGAGYYFSTYQSTSYLMLGKQGATLTFQPFDFAVSKIELEGTTSASTSVTYNIYVDGNEASTAATGSTGTHTFEIASAYQAAGNVYTLKVTNAKNVQITSIKIYKK